MKEFNTLRAKARDKRDKAIASAKRDYEATLVQIAALEQGLLGEQSNRPKKISACIDSLIPAEGTFTSLDIMTGLEGLDPGRDWRKRSVDLYMARLRGKGIIRRVRRHRIGEPAIYARADAQTVEEAPTGDMPLVEVIRAVLTKPMTATEVMMAALDAGYESTMGRSQLRNQVDRQLHWGKFKRQGGKWVAE